MMTFDAITPIQFASGASWQSPLILCAGYSRVEFWVRWYALAGCAGTLRLRGGAIVNDAGEGPAAGFADIDDFAITTGAYGAWPTVTAAAGKACIVVVNPVARMGVGYLHAGGAVNAGHFEFYAVRSR